jgi:hypothetical protein
MEAIQETPEVKVQIEDRAPEVVSKQSIGMDVVRKRPIYNQKNKTCYCCGAVKTGPHHIIPRSEGGLPIFDNIAWLCVLCHDAVEGPSVGARERLESRKLDCKDARQKRTQPKVRLDHDKVVLDKSLADFEKEVRRFGFLGERDQKAYQFLLADYHGLWGGTWNKLTIWCLWQHQDFHVEAMNIAYGTCDYSNASEGLKQILREMPESLCATIGLKPIEEHFRPLPMLVQSQVAPKAKSQSNPAASPTVVEKGLVEAWTNGPLRRWDGKDMGTYVCKGCRKPVAGVYSPHWLCERCDRDR